MMQLSKEIFIEDLAIYLKKSKTLILSDLHLGYENYLEKKGVLLPRFQLKDTHKKVEKLLKKLEVKVIIFNGDLKHEFGRILEQEWKDIGKLIDSLKDYKIIVIKGNHDVLLSPILNKKNIKIVKEHRIGKILITHGDSLPEIPKETRVIILGHEHPAISFKEHGRVEKYKCFLIGRHKSKRIIVQPSFNSLIEGSDVIKKGFFSPFLKEITDFKVFVVNNGKVLDFGKLNKLKLNYRLKTTKNNNFQ